MTSGIGGAEADDHQAGARPAARRQSADCLGGALRASSICNKRSTETPANVPLRGIEPTALQVRDEVKMVEGRMFQFGTNEAIVGQSRGAAVRGRRSRV